MKLRIGDWIVVPALNLIERKGKSIKLEPRAMDLLVYLANAGDRVVSTDELLRAVWQGRVFDDGIVYGKINHLRKALGDDSKRPLFIATVPKRGYRFVATVARSDADPTPEGGAAAGAAPRVQPHPPAPTLRARLAAARVAALAAVGMLAVVAVVAYMQTRSSDGARLPHNSIAILPFEDLSPDPGDAYFAAGVHQEILSQLGQIKALRLVSRTSVLRYSGSQLTIPELGRELGVASIMEGSIRYAGGRIRVAVQLVDTATDRRLWSETYEHELADIFATQADIAANVANALQAQLLPAERARMSAVPTESMEAYALYLRAADIGGPAAIELLERAIAIDDRFALAYATLARANAFNLTNTNGADVAPSSRHAEVEGIARAMAATALQIDAEMASAHTALGVLSWTSWRWGDAERSLAHAIEIAPNDPIACNVYGSLLSALGRHAEALALAERALVLNPGNPNACWYAFHLASAGALDEAAAVFEAAIAGSPDNLLLRDWLALVESARGNKDASVRQLELAEQLALDNRLITFLPEWAYGYGLAGRTEDAQRIFAEITRLDAHGRSPGAGGWAMAHLAVGDETRALEWLNVARAKAAAHERDEGFFNLMVLRMNIGSDARLRTPAFAAVLTEIAGD